MVLFAILMRASAACVWFIEGVIGDADAYDVGNGNPGGPSDWTCRKQKSDLNILRREWLLGKINERLVLSINQGHSRKRGVRRGGVSTNPHM
jgi:hypothetical protein